MVNKTVLITGAGKRLGACMARTLHSENMDIILHYNTSHDATLQAVKDMNAIRPDSALAVQANLSEAGSLESLATSALKFKHKLDVLINNASSFYPTPISQATTEQWEDLMGTNMKIPFFLSQALQPELKKQKGCIVNITDIHGNRPLRDHPIYTSAKAGLLMLTRALAKDLAPEIRVNAISPGAIIWPDNMDTQTMDKILSEIPAGKKGQAEDIANAALFLINHAEYVTGEVINVDGGRRLSF